MADERLTKAAEYERLRSALKDLLEVVEMNDSLMTNNDLEPYKWEAIRDDAIRRAQDAVNEKEPQ